MPERLLRHPDSSRRRAAGSRRSPPSRTVSPRPVAAARRARNGCGLRVATSGRTSGGESFTVMPELPETETMARDLHREIAGRTIERVAVRRPDVLREVNAKELARRTRCVTIVRSWRRAKLVVLDLSSTDRIVVQPRFTGALLLDRGALDESERRFSTLEFALGDSLTLHYRDIRRLGTVSLMSPERWASYESGLGVEP